MFEGPKRPVREKIIHINLMVSKHYQNQRTYCQKIYKPSLINIVLIMDLDPSSGLRPF